MGETGLQVEVDGNTRAVRLAGELDLSTVDRAEQAIRELGDAEGDLTLDVRALTFVDSTGIRLLLRTATAMPQGARLVLRLPSPAVVRVLEVTGLVEVLGGRLVVERGDGT